MPDMQEIMQYIDPSGLQMETPAAAAFTAAGVALGAGLVYAHHRSDEKQATPILNEALLRHSVHEVGADTSAADRAATRYRVGPVAATMVGLGILGTGLVGGFTHETDSPNPDAEVVIVADRSYSMEKTADITGGLTRSDSFYNALVAATPNYPGRAAFIEVADDTHLNIPMSSDWSSQLVAQQGKEPMVDPNGGDVARAMREAAALLPIVDAGATSEGEIQQRRGVVLIGSDGTISNTPEQVTAAAEELKAQGITIKAIVPGTPTGSYELGGTTTQSAITSDVFAGIGTENITIADNQEAINGAVNTVLTEQGTQIDTNPYALIAILGGAIAVGGALTTGVRVATRRQ